MVSNAIKVLPAFYSVTASMDKARDFWELFEAHTSHLPDRSRLLVFRQRIKGSEAERWWNNSTIKTFATLKVRFHNLFLSRTADQLWERLQPAHRERGESVEEWGDRVTGLCDSLDYPNRKMRYQLFRCGLRNKRILGCLDSGPARDIPEACECLLAKEMSRPIEEDDEFSDEKKKSSGSPRGNGRPVRGIRMGANSRTQEGAPVCGRCGYVGHSRETCRRQSMTCHNCGVHGHIAVGCEAGLSNYQRGPGTVGRNGGRGVTKCAFCEEEGHLIGACPGIVALRGAAQDLRTRSAQTASNQ
ncbi:hypothetical protein PHYSODRAFT_467974 [Phytophthora sojae]|uniref:CCHC-type domain-containing protein n=1 Tax=Phytophthora sojae (strain P6497) TaxID=1094619 RepID=G4YNH5_PHYSP|nr:hypothetical protein PHYSODRAFT_467974 [Phytophthora sojae]EGZ30374.1 hypothetical protein PHYSODRAFT_467974 [Phytophthora sojae]|eukprot:XP_009517649.1 hypothetical protein PHYSODRAFT_467974 [Phytophthora sojae]